jgi:acyl-CoA thioesterase
VSRPADRLLVNLVLGPDYRCARFTVAPSGRPDGAMYGGAGSAAAVMAMEAATQREVLWVTTQFVRAPRSGQIVECRTDILADGGRTAQVQVIGSVGDSVAFVALGSTGRPRPDGLHGQFVSMPAVAPPGEQAPQPWSFNNPGGGQSAVCYTAAEMPDRTFGHVALWARRRHGEPFSPAALAYVADMVPIAVARAAGRVGAGSSLDNSLRFGEVGEHEWVLLELAGDLATGGYGHGSLRAWAMDGTLLATGGQTTNMKYLFDEAEIPRLAAAVAARAST